VLITARGPASFVDGMAHQVCVDDRLLAVSFLLSLQTLLIRGRLSPPSTRGKQRQRMNHTRKQFHGGNIQKGRGVSKVASYHIFLTKEQITVGVGFKRGVPFCSVATTCQALLADAGDCFLACFIDQRNRRQCVITTNRKVHSFEKHR
jgi:hypothetical protein